MITKKFLKDTLTIVATYLIIGYISQCLLIKEYGKYYKSIEKNTEEILKIASDKKVTKNQKEELEYAFCFYAMTGFSMKKYHITSLNEYKEIQKKKFKILEAPINLKRYLNLRRKNRYLRKLLKENS